MSKMYCPRCGAGLEVGPVGKGVCIDCKCGASLAISENDGETGEWSVQIVPPKQEPGGYEVTLNQDYDDCERGNTLLVHTEEFWLNAWLALDDLPNGDKVRLEIFFRPENYPALGVRLVRISDEDLYQHLVKEFGSLWEIRKLNLVGHDAHDLEEAWVAAETSDEEVEEVKQSEEEQRPERDERDGP